MPKNHPVILHTNTWPIANYYVWVVENKNGAKGIFALKARSGNVLAATFSLDLAKRMGKTIKTMNFSGVRFKLLHFQKPRTIKQI